MSTGSKIYRSNDRIIGGVCAGIADYLDIDATIFRIGYALLTVCTAFSGVLLYLLLWIVIPPKS